ncbi:MAG: response regulator [Candidatus Omnitrophota bacterium]
MEKGNIYSVLILDDEIMILRSLERALKVKGFITWTSKHQEEAIRLVASHRPSIACIDLHMPHVNGIEVIKKMREIMPDIRVIVVTGYLEMYQEQLKPLNVRVVDKTARINLELESTICEELELSRRDLEGIKARKKPKTKLRILFVDDEIESADFSAEIAREMGAQADSAHSPEDALRKAPIFKPNVLASDLKMQNMDGDELIRKMKEGDHSYIKVYVGITGFFHEKDRFFKAGAKEVLTKPVNLTDFTDALKRWADLLDG